MLLIAMMRKTLRCNPGWINTVDASRGVIQSHQAQLLNFSSSTILAITPEAIFTPYTRSRDGAAISGQQRRSVLLLLPCMFGNLFANECRAVLITLFGGVLARVV